MIKIDKRYTIKYSKSGVAQYADFKYANGKLIQHTFRPSWVKSDEIPSIDDAKNFDEILAIIKDFSYCNNADVYLVDGNIVAYDKIKDTIKDDLLDFGNEYDDLVAKRFLELFKKHIAPILNRNKWFISTSWIGRPVLVYYDDNNELDNIDDCVDSDLIYYISNRIMACVGLNSTLDLKTECSNRINDGDFSSVIGKLEVDTLIEMGIYIMND